MAKLSAPATPSTATASAGAAGEGKSVYDTTCHVCHGTGLAGSPKFGDKAAWAPRIATGMPALYNAALHGLNAMPPKGGNTALSDAQVKAAVDYMVGAAK
jgi:cytochrome c5